MRRQARGLIFIMVLTAIAIAAIAVPRIDTGAIGIDFERGNEDTFLGLTLGLDLQGGTHLVYQAFTEDGWLKTGDIGVILDSGHLQITDRKKDLIVTAAGKNIAPAQFENRLKAECSYVSNVLMYGDKHAFCVALIAIDEAMVARWAASHEITYTDYADLTAKLEVKDLIWQGVDAVNKTLPSYETVKKIALLPADLTVEDGSLTPTLKVKRRVVNERYQHLLDELYAGELEQL